MNQQPIVHKDFSLWQYEIDVLDKKNFYFRITFLVLSLLAVATGCVGTYFLHSHLGNWTFAIGGGALVIGIVLVCLGIHKKIPFHSSTKQKLFNHYVETIRHFLENSNLNELGHVLGEIANLPLAPISFLKNFISDTKENYPQEWRKCAVAILTCNLESLQKVLATIPDGRFWETKYNNYDLLALAALMVNHSASNHQMDPLLDYGYKHQKDILVFLHQSYAKHLETLDPEKKAQLQSEALFQGAELCLRKMTLKGLLLNGSEDVSIQESFALITKAYVPLCPHTLYVTQESLEKIDPFYNANQRMYAEWCHITALALQGLLTKKSMQPLLEMGARSRYWLAHICKSENAENYGQYRLKDGKLSTLCTPINDPQFPRYMPWYDITHNQWIANKAYAIYAKDTDGTQEPGTTFGLFRFIRNEKLSNRYFCWQHGIKLEQLHQIAERWLLKIMNSDEKTTDQFYQDLGAFYHVLCQYTPFERGSATFSYILIAALLMNGQVWNLPITLPQAVSLLDCYALSMQSNEFITTVFIPWCKGEIKLDQVLKNTV